MKKVGILAIALAGCHPRMAPPAEPLARDACSGEPVGLVRRALGYWDVACGLEPIHERVRVCSRRHGAAGAAVTVLVIGPQGVVRAAEVRGPLAGTAAAACVEEALRSARFPRFRGPPIAVGGTFRMGR